MAESCCRIVLTTVDTAEAAQGIARALLERRLAACVNIISGVASMYRWQEKLESASEVILLIKTEEDRLAGLESALREHHPYEVPEFLVVPVSAGSRDYLDWVHNCVKVESSSMD